MSSSALALRGLNHASFVVSDVSKSAQFYRDVLGFSIVRRPTSFQFDGCWLWRLGFGIHLIRGDPVNKGKTEINPRSDHLSFVAVNLDTVEKQLVSLEVKYVLQCCEEDGLEVRQIFFHDPDNNMIEVCNCDEFPISGLEVEEHSMCAGATGVCPMLSPVPSQGSEKAASRLHLQAYPGCGQPKPVSSCSIEPRTPLYACTPPKHIHA